MSVFSPMRSRRSTMIAASLLLAVGLAAAVLGHQLVHACADAGWFPTDYDAYAHAALLPLVLLAAAFGALGAALAVGEPAGDFDRWLSDAVRVIARRRWREIALVVIAIQLTALFGMESVEQLLALGHPLGGFAWMGGPPLAALLVHLSAALLSVVALIGGTRSLARVCRLVVAILAMYVNRLRALPHGECPRCTTPAPRHRRNVSGRCLSKRGPPIPVSA